MKQVKWLGAPVALTLALGLTGSALLPVAHAAGKAGQKGAAKGGQKAATGAREIKHLEDVLGKPLTDEQKTAVLDAQKSYRESVAKAVGLTVDELAAKEKEYRAAHPGGARGGKGGAAAAPKPAG